LNQKKQKHSILIPLQPYIYKNEGRKWLLPMGRFEAIEEYSCLEKTKRNEDRSGVGMMVDKQAGAEE
jgi:hypothetical protein